MVIHQGDIYWVDLEEPTGSGPGYRHPHVVVQNNLFNRSRIHTVIVCMLSSNLHRADSPGNVLLNAGEANLPKQSVILVSQISSIDKSQLGDYIGTLSQRRLLQVLDGVMLLLKPRDVD
jgi:mRNA interferase MazF